MTVETKFYCDECGKETVSGVSLAVMAIEGLYEMPSAFDLEKFNKIPWQHKEVYNKFLCLDCLGEAIEHPTIGEHDRYFTLKEKARAFLIKHGFLKPKGQEREIWEKIGQQGGVFIGLRFLDTAKAPSGLVFQVADQKYIVRSGRLGYLQVEPYW